MHLFWRKKCSIWKSKKKIYVYVKDANYKNDNGDENNYDDHFHYICVTNPLIRAMPKRKLVYQWLAEMLLSEPETEVTKMDLHSMFGAGRESTNILHSMSDAPSVQWTSYSYDTYDEWKIITNNVQSAVNRLVKVSYPGSWNPWSISDKWSEIWSVTREKWLWVRYSDLLKIVDQSLCAESSLLFAINI